MANDSEMLLINIPFDGFYDSIYSDEVDHIAEREADNFADDRQTEEGVPPELRLDAQTVASILFDVTDYHAIYAKVAEEYTAAFNEVASELLDVPLSLTFESMTSPREYNFATDRIFAHIPLATVQALFDKSAADNHATLAACIKERFTSYDGFLSGYDNTLAAWLDKPLIEWDHNELGTLLVALLGDDSDWRMDVYYRTTEHEGVYNAWSDGVDWAKFDARVQEHRDELLADLKAADPDYIEPAYRCPNTPDMFAASRGEATS